MIYHWLNDSWTRRFKLVARGFEPVTHQVELVTHKFKLVDLKLHFWISTRVFKLWTVSRNLCFSISRTGIFSKIIFVLRGSHEDAYFNRVVLHLLLNICKGVQFLVKWHVIEVIFQSFWSQAWNNYIVSHLFAEQLLLKDTSQKLPLRLGNLRKLADKHLK